MKRIKVVGATVAMLAAMTSMLAGCGRNDAYVASQNLSTAADNFEIERRIVFYNTYTDKYTLEITGLCSIGKGESIDNEITVTCKTGPNEYKKHFLAVGDSLTFFSEQIESAKADPYRYRVVFKPESIVPIVDVR